MPERKEYLDERVFMNTRVRIKVISDKGTVYTLKKIDKAFDQFRYVVDKFTRFKDTSELSGLNANSGKPYKVSGELVMLLKIMLEIARKTEGAYDPTVIDLLEAYGYDSNYDFKKLDNPRLYEEIQAIALKRPSFREIKIDEKKTTVKLAKGQRIDMGSIGKGYAIDLAAEILEEFGNYIVNAGGDIRCLGRSIDNEPWRVGLMRTQAPNAKLSDYAVFGYVELEEGSVTGSGGWARRVKFFHHLLNPKTGLPVNKVSQTYTIGKKATEADAWSTALFTMGKEGLDLIEKTDDLEGMIVMTDGSIFKTKGFHYYM